MLGKIYQLTSRRKVSFSRLKEKAFLASPPKGSSALSKKGKEGGGKAERGSILPYRS